MNKIEIANLIKGVADATSDYGHIRSDGNLGMAIQGFALIEASKNIENGLIELGKSIEKISINIEQNNIQERPLKTNRKIYE